MASMTQSLTSVKFDSRNRPRQNRLFGLGLAKPGRVKTTGYTASDRQWAAANLNSTGISEDEAARLELLTMSPSEYHELTQQVDAELGHTDWALGDTAATMAASEAPDMDDATADAMAADSAEMDRLESIPTPTVPTIEDMALAIRMAHSAAIETSAAYHHAACNHYHAEMNVADKIDPATEPDRHARAIARADSAGRIANEASKAFRRVSKLYPYSFDADEDPINEDWGLLTIDGRVYVLTTDPDEDTATLISPKGDVYTIDHGTADDSLTSGPNIGLRCDCPDFAHRHAGTPSHGCKHIQSVQATDLKRRARPDWDVDAETAPESREDYLFNNFRDYDHSR